MSAPRLEAAGRHGTEQARRLARAALEASVRAFSGESVRLRAMALTYLSIFALVPALLVAFSVVQAFTGMDRMASQVNEFLLDNLAVGARASVEPYLERFVANAHVASTGLVGGALLIWSMVSLFSDVDGAINDLWGVRRRRRLRDQVVTYWVGLTIGPLLLAGSVYLGHLARVWLAGTGSSILVAMAGGLLTCTFLSTLYLLVPNTKVRLGPAVAAGLVAGVAWELAKWGYAIAVTRFFRYNLVYGSVAVIPTFLIWLYLSWTILLFGARVAFVVQNAPVLWRGGPLADHPTTREALAGRLMLQVALAFDGEQVGAWAPDF
jgi:membrane protein